MTRYLLTFGSDAGAATGEFLGNTAAPASVEDGFAASLIVPRDGRIGKIALFATDGVNVAATVSVIVVKNGVDTALVCSIPAGSQSGFGSDTNAFNAARGDRIRLRFTTNTDQPLQAQLQVF